RRRRWVCGSDELAVHPDQPAIDEGFPGGVEVTAPGFPATHRGQSPPSQTGGPDRKRRAEEGIGSARRVRRRRAAGNGLGRSRRWGSSQNRLRRCPGRWQGRILDPQRASKSENLPLGLIHPEAVTFDEALLLGIGKCLGVEDLPQELLLEL